MYWDSERCEYYGAFISIINGNRGCGKTYRALNLGVERYLESNERFVYLRRFKNELIAAKANLLSDMPFENEMKVEGNKLLCDKLEMGYTAALTTTRSIKFPESTSIIFDEYNPVGYMNRTIPNEFSVFINFIETVKRNSKKKFRIYMLGNPIGYGDYYLEKLGLYLPKQGSYYFDKERSIYIENVMDNEFYSQKMNSEIGKLLGDSDILRNMYGGEFINSHNDVGIKSLSRFSKICFNFKHNNKIYGVWMDGDYFIISNNYNTKIRRTMTLDKDEIREDLPYMSDKEIRFYFLNPYKRGYLKYSNKKVREEISPIIRRVI